MTTNRNIIIWILVTILLPLAVYRNSLNNPLFHADKIHLAENQLVKADPARLFITKENIDLRPAVRAAGLLVVQSFGLSWMAGGLKPVYYRMVNLGGHMLVTALLFLIVFLLSDRIQAALFASLFFALNPFNSEAVNYIIARYAILAALFTMAAFLCFVLSCRSKGRKGAVIYLLLSLAFFTAGLFSDISAAALLLLIIWYDYRFTGTEEYTAHINRFIRHVPYWLAGAAFLASGQAALFPPDKAAAAPPLTEGLHAAAILAGRAIFPAGLSINNLAGAIPGHLLLSASAAAILFILSGIYCGFSRSQNDDKQLFAFGTGWFIAAIIPVIILISLQNDFIAEHKGYLAAAGIATSVGILFDSAARQKRYIPVLFFLLILFFSYLTVKRNSTWESELSIWEDAVMQAPDSWPANLYLGAAFTEHKLFDDAEKSFFTAYKNTPYSADAAFFSGMMKEYRSRPDEAVRFYFKTLDLRPGHYSAYDRLGMIYAKKRRFSEAVVAFKQAIMINLRRPEAHLHLGETYSSMNQFGNAQIAYNLYVKLFPDDFTGYYKLGLLYKQHGGWRDALPKFLQANRLNPDHTGALFELGLIYQKEHHYAKAIGAYTRLLALDPDNYDAHNNLGLIHEDQQQFDKALKEYEAAVRLRPNSHIIHNNLGMLHLKMGNTIKAKEEFETSLHINPGYIDALYNMAVLLANAGMKEESAAYYRKVIKMALENPALYGAYLNKIVEDLRASGEAGKTF